MKKLSVLLLAIFIGMFNACWAVKTLVITPLVQSSIKKYKAGDYLGARQDIEEAIKKNPDDSIANYYAGNIYTQIGEKYKAMDSYKKVVTLNENKGLSTYAGVALICLEAPEKMPAFVNPIEVQVGGQNQNSGQGDDKCKLAKDLLKGSEAEQQMNAFIRSGQFMHQEVKDKMREKSIQGVQNKFNSDEKDVDFSQFKYLNDASGTMPSDKEIADAVKTLAKVGFNPLNFSAGQGFNPQLAQLNYTAPSGSSGYGFEMLPYLMQHSDNYNDNKISPQLLQNMMMGQLMSSYDFGGTNQRGY